jgi:hypothetical protein
MYTWKRKYVLYLKLEDFELPIDLLKKKDHIG